MPRSIRVLPTVCRRVATLRRLIVRFRRASSDTPRDRVFRSTYVAKPLVTFDGAAMFFELAVLRGLEVDGCDGVSLDSFLGRKSLDGNAHGVLTG